MAESSSSKTTLYSRRRLQGFSTINWLRNFRRFYISKCSLPSPILWCLQEYKCRWNPKQIIKRTSIVQINVHAQCFGPDTNFTINSVFIIAIFFLYQNMLKGNCYCEQLACCSLSTIWLKRASMKWTNIFPFCCRG